MNREIKFRAWDILNVKPKMVTPNNGDLIGWHAPLNWYNCYEIMQFTGLHDSENTPIFEGDILEFQYTDKCEESGFGIVHAVVSFERGMFVCKEIGFNYDRSSELPSSLYEFMSGEVITIVGNIYEHPEFLPQRGITIKQKKK